MPNETTSRGFTLIELLAVIAIIAILAGLTAAALPRAIEQARLADTRNDLNQIRTALASYYADHGSFPLAYGFRTWASWEAQVTGDASVPDPLDPNDRRMVNREPYMAAIGQYGAIDLYDRFSDQLDSDNDELISRLEYSPRLDLNSGQSFNDLPFFNTVAPFDPGLMEDNERPYVYAPVNRGTFRRLSNMIKKYPNFTLQRTDGGSNWVGWDGSVWPTPADPSELFPLVSAQYDAYVLLSVGPQGDTAGVVSPIGPGQSEADFANSLLARGYTPLDIYQALSYRTYYLATRDANNNQQLDFDFNARAKQGEGSALAETFRGTVGSAEEQAVAGYMLPSGSLAGGPMIYHNEG